MFLGYTVSGNYYCWLRNLSVRRNVDCGGLVNGKTVKNVCSHLEEMSHRDGITCSNKLNKFRSECVI